ncbi:MAG: hypothetical protein P1P82_15975 [Bacteroidales bacterium]|nr:hypothetical protein [Bacteroidales bacterium]MDT8432753.1 hypothetical protein [Bacteroidales bacterium]
MEILLEILKYTLPSLILFFTVYFFLRTWSKQEEKRRKHEFNMHLKDDILPVRLQAYERIILFLERIAPESILMRIKRQGMTAAQLQAELQNTIRHEYDHNLSQQTYVSSDAWKMVQMARNHILKIINESAGELKEDASSATLGKLILEKVMELKTPPSQVAIDYLKKEVQELFLQ